MGRSAMYAFYEVFTAFLLSQYYLHLASSFKLLMIPIILWANWELLAPYVAKGIENPFAPMLFISHRVPSSSPEDPRYQKGWLDLVFVAYYIVVWSFFRQAITLHFFQPLARKYGIKKAGKLERFGEQGHAMAYFAVMSCWGFVSSAC